MSIGNFCLILAVLLSFYGVVVGLWAALNTRLTTDIKQRFLRSAEYSVHLTAVFAVISLVDLGTLFLKHDYRYAYVWRTSNNDMHPLYLVSAIWGGMDGSLLLWAAMISVFASAALYFSKSASRQHKMWLPTYFSLASGFFLFVTAVLTNPFRLIPTEQIPLDGNGLNPLLQNPSMLIHPPLLYAGFTGFMVPFVFSLAALSSGHFPKGDRSWTLQVRNWTLTAWTFLTAGIILGGNWAYIELGWGGFWAWDPVENASFFPWLSGTAYLHSVMVEKQRGMLKVWNVGLAILTYLLCVFGTFLTRSGVVQSVHAFAETDVGWVFLLYLGILLVLSTILICYRMKELRPENHLESLTSKEAFFLFNNLALLGILFATIWGVLYPVFSEAFTGTKEVVGPPFFNKVNVPLFLLLLFLMGMGPVIAWRRANLRTLRKIFLTPFIFGSAVSLLCFYLDNTRVLSAVAFGLCAFITHVTISEFHRAAKARQHFTGGGYIDGLLGAYRRKFRRFTGFIVHLGVVIMTVAITASMAYKLEVDMSLAIGEQKQVGHYTIVLDSIKRFREANYEGVWAKILVLDGESSEFLTALYPERRFYFKSRESTTEVDIRTTLRDDLYLALAGLEQDGLKAALKVYLNPLQVWLWVGSVIMLLGSVSLIIAEVWSKQRQEETHLKKSPSGVNALNEQQT